MPKFVPCSKQEILMPSDSLPSFFVRMKKTLPDFSAAPPPPAGTTNSLTPSPRISASLESLPLYVAGRRICLHLPRHPVDFVKDIQYILSHVLS